MKEDEKKKGEIKKLKDNEKKLKHFLIHPIFRTPKTFGQRASDFLTKWAGSWAFILLFLFFILVWIFINGYYLIQYAQGVAFDPYPFILLNLALSCLAAIQAPVILMSQNRQTQRDRLKAEFDYRINRKAEKEIREIKRLLLNMKKKGK